MRSTEAVRILLLILVLPAYAVAYLVACIMGHGPPLERCLRVHELQDAVRRRHE